HNGIDYKTGAGMPIYAAAAGTVVYKYYNTNPSAGTVDSGLYIDHDNGYRTAYWHMDPIEVEYGQTVKAGDLIGYSGNIGQSSGAHLHFGLRMVNGNKAVDPFGWWSTTVTDTWGGSDWMWEGDSIADMGEAQTQLFYRSYWYKVDSGYNGSSFWTYEVSTSGSSTNWAVWGTYIETAGQYRVYAYWPSDSTNTTNAKYKIFHSGGVTTVSVNQATNGDKFVLLGTYNFGIGSAAVIMNDYTGGSGGKVRFDAVKWEPINAPTSTPTRTPTVTATAKPTATSTASGAKLTNIAVGKPASQSSVYRDSTTSGIPVLAVDGNTNGDYFSGSVTHTKDEANPWWQVDLGAVQSIEKINLWNRTSCCSERLSNFYVFVKHPIYIHINQPNPGATRRRCLLLCGGRAGKH
ncbi:MAG: peptidoglycan DD-metalloendopeptidase family protein, partial [Anaerolineaceae bacterium]